MDKLGIIDGVIIVIITLSILTGMIRGFVKELIALCVWIAAIWLGIVYADAVGEYFKHYITDEIVCHAAGFVIILLSVLITGSLFNALLGFILKNTGLSGTDRLLGMLFGGVRGIFLVSLIIYAIKITDLLPAEEHLNKSILYSKFTPVVDWLYEISPNFVKHLNSTDNDEEIKTNI